VSAPVPTLPELKVYLGASSGVPDSEIRLALDTEQTAQAAACRVEPYNAALAGALRRRVARNLAMKGVPLGVQMDEFGATRVGYVDPEIRRLEGPYKRIVFG